jgi:hypothetical protein
MYQATLPPQSGVAPHTTSVRTASVTRSRSAYFSSQHPLAEVARHRCRSHHPRAGGSPRLGNVACGACWEHAIRTDERFVVEHGLDDEPEVPADYLDQVAVHRALTGRRVTLTAAERAEAAWLLVLRRTPLVEVAERLHVKVGTVHQALVLGPVQPGPASSDPDGQVAM